MTPQLFVCRAFLRQRGQIADVLKPRRTTSSDKVSPSSDTAAGTFLI
jgi:hypothetical protein